MTNETETITNSINTTVDSVVEEVKTPSVHPAVGVVGVSTIGGFLGALVAGPIGAILGGTLGAYGASLENTKLAKSGYYTKRKIGSMQSGQPLDALSDIGKEIAQDVGEVAAAVQQETSHLASNATATIAKVGNNLSDSKKGVLLDVDGTLVISNDAHAHAWVEAFAAFGYDISFDQVRPLIGMGADQVVPRLAPLSDDEGVGKQITDHRKELIMNKFGSTLSPAPGSRDLILKLKQEGFQLVVASSATSEELSVLLKAAQVDDLLLDKEPVTTSDDADNSKPAPDLVQAALKKGKLDASRAIMLGDTPYDIQAANAAGVGVIAFRCGGFNDSQLSGALAIYDSPADLLAQFERSPLKPSETALIEP